MIRYEGHQWCPTFAGKTIEYRLKVVEGRWNTIVVATDLSDDIYSSITLHTDELATHVCDTFGIDRARLLWIEHIPSSQVLGRNEDLWDLVHFDEQGGMLTRPVWTPLSSEEVELLTGGSLDDVVTTFER